VPEVPCASSPLCAFFAAPFPFALVLVEEDGCAGEWMADRLGSGAIFSVCAIMLGR
jgi:hypothetical protein